MFKRVFARDKNWAKLLPRLVDAGLLTVDQAVMEMILAQR